ncbi:hypothetical protein Bca4012_031745 [Brassica carinata]
MQVFQIWKTSETTKFLCLIFLHLVTSCCIKFLLFSQTKTLQTHYNLFDLKTPNFI